MWKSTGGSASMCSLNSCERIRPERARNPIQRLVWGPGAQFQVAGYPGIVDEELSCNPRVALRRLLRLYEGRQYREAASFLLRLPRYTFKAALPDIPVDLIVESLPHSLSLLEAVYTRLLGLALSDDSSIDDAMLERIEHQVLWRVVHHISITDNLRDAQIWSKLLVTLSKLSPGSKKLLASRRRSLERAVEGLGKHGLVPSNTNVEDRRWNSANSTNASRGSFIGIGFANSATIATVAPRSVNNAGKSSMTALTAIGQSAGTIANISPGVPPTTLLPLTAKLRDELETRLEAYKLALHKIESWGKHNIAGGGIGGGVGVGGTRSKAEDRQVRAASHQRQLSLKYSEVQQRLIDNQSLLNVLGKPCDRNLEDLIGELRCRVERDKEALRQWNAVKKSSGLTNGTGSLASTKNTALAASLLQFSRACSVALRLMNESFDTSSSYQDTTKEFVNLREDRFEAAESSSSAGYHTDDSCSPTPEPVVILATENSSVTSNKDGDTPEYTANGYSWTTEQLTDRYVALYAHAHLHTLDALDALEPLKDATDLKAKILFSVVVLSWRVAEIVQASRRLEAVKTLNGDSTEANTTFASMMNLTGSSSRELTSSRANEVEKLSNNLEEFMNHQIARFGYHSGTRQVAERVLSQLERTLYDFPCLRQSAELKRYAAACSSLAWICLARETPLILDVAKGFTKFDSEIHARHHASPDSQGSKIVAVLWPGLLLRETTRTTCLYRAVVLTATSISQYADSSDAD